MPFTLCRMKSNKTNVLVVGYPKSGNTWVVRLVAEIAQCPVVGFWDSDQDEIATEHSARVSDYQCFKSHHQYNDIKGVEIGRDKIIYVVRDPRDVVLSGAHYFNRVSPFRKNKMSQTLLGRAINKMHWLAFGESLMIGEMVDAVCCGNEWIHRWCAVSWKTHISGFQGQTGIHFVRYEDLLEQPMVEAKAIVGFLKIERSEEELSHAIENQSFRAVKSKFKAKGDKERQGFMRKGGKGDWNSKLSKRQLSQIITELSETMRQFGY